MSNEQDGAEVERTNITINNEKLNVPQSISTVSEFLSKCDYSPEKHELYRIEGVGHVGPLGEMLVFDEGDRFVAIPRHVNDGG